MADLSFAKVKLLNFLSLSPLSLQGLVRHLRYLSASIVLDCNSPNLRIHLLPPTSNPPPLLLKIGDFIITSATYVTKVFDQIDHKIMKGANLKVLEVLEIEQNG